MSTFKKYGKYIHNATDFWGNEYKNEVRTRFNVTFNNCGNKGHEAVGC